MHVKNEHHICDVCDHKVYVEFTKIKFSRDNKDYEFDCCYDCLRGNRIRMMYKKIADIIKKLL